MVGRQWRSGGDDRLDLEVVVGQAAQMSYDSVLVDRLIVRLVGGCVR